MLWNFPRFKNFWRAVRDYWPHFWEFQRLIIQSYSHQIMERQVRPEMKARDPRTGHDEISDPRTRPRWTRLDDKSLEVWKAAYWGSHHDLTVTSPKYQSYLFYSGATSINRIQLWNFYPLMYPFGYKRYRSQNQPRYNNHFLQMIMVRRSNLAWAWM